MKIQIYTYIAMLSAITFIGCASPTGELKSSTKAITTFSIATPAINGTIVESAHAITVTVPNGTEVTALTPIITHTGVSINPASNTAQDFTTPVTYIVTAEDGTKQSYSATVTVAPALLTLTFKANGGTGSDYTQTVETAVRTKLMDNTFTKEGHDFVGWSVSPGKRISFIDGFSTYFSSELILYACWNRSDATEPASFTVLPTDSSTNEYTLTNYSGSARNVVVPNYIEGRPVVSISAEAFYLNEVPVSIELPDSVVNIGDWAFCQADNLVSISIPNSVTTIGEMAFSGCSNLASVSIPDSVTSLGAEAFDYCTNLETATLGKSLTHILMNTFRSCSRLLSIDIPDAVTTIGDRAFYQCQNLTSVVLGASLNTIGASALAGTGISSLFIPASITDIATVYSQLSTCPNLTEITVDSSNTAYSAVDGVLFDKNEKTLLCYPHAKSSSSYTIPSTVTTIAAQAFSGNDTLGSVSAGNSDLTEIKSGAFAGCSALTSVDAGSKITTIEDTAFASCGNLISFNIPDSATSVGHRIFADCQNLTTIFIGKSVTSIGSWFGNETLKLQKLNVSSENTEFASIDGILFSKNLTTLFIYPMGKTGTSYEIPNSVTGIADNAFQYATTVSSITIPASVTWIGSCAFNCCDALATIFLKPIEPPQLADVSALFNNQTAYSLYVPASSDDSIITAYKNASNWSAYADNFIEE